MIAAAQASLRAAEARKREIDRRSRSTGAMALGLVTEGGAGEEDRMIKGLWNLGIKTDNLDAEVDFLQRMGAQLVLRERFDAGDGQSLEYAILRLGGVRMLLFPKTIFEDRIEGGVRPGLTHAVYEVDDLEAEYRRIKALGARVLVEPREITAGFGRRKLAFFLSPGGLAFEVMQILEDRLS